MIMFNRYGLESDRFSGFLLEKINGFKKTICSFVVCIMVLLVPFSNASGAEPQRNDTVTFEDGIKYFNSGMFEDAYSIFYAFFKENPGDREINLYLGMAAFEKGDFESALMIFDRMLIMDPDDPRAKLEMARTYLSLGQKEAARKMFNEVLKEDLPEPVKNNVKDYLLAISESGREHFFDGGISYDIVYDTNANAAPVNPNANNIFTDPKEEHVPTWMDQLETSSKDDFINNISMGLMYRFQPPESVFSWHASAATYHAIYADEGEFDLDYFMFQTGPLFRIKDTDIGFKGHFNYLLQDSDEYLNSFGIQFSAIQKIRPNIIGYFKLRWELRDFSDTSDEDSQADEDTTGGTVSSNNEINLDEDLDSDNYNIQIGGSYFLGHNRFDLQFANEKDNADLKYNGYRSRSVFLKYSRILPYDMTASSSFQFKYTKDNDENPNYSAYNNSDPRRTDKLYESAIGLSKRFWQSRNLEKAAFIQLAFTYSYNKSTVEVFRFEKQVTSLGINFGF